MISAVVLTKNEEKNIVDCLESLSFCDEVIVIDDNSGDRTREIAKKMSARVFVRSLNGNFSSQRNFGLDKASQKWVLFVDADERVTSELSEELIKLTKDYVFAGAFIKRLDFMWGRALRHGETGNIKFLRFAKNGAGIWEGKVHEEWKIEGETITPQNPLLHYPHQTIAEFLYEINYYTGIRSKELHDSGIKVYWYSIIIHPVGKFLLNFFLKLGFLDGAGGFVFAIIMSFHSFLVRGKLWTLQRK